MNATNLVHEYEVDEKVQELKEVLDLAQEVQNKVDFLKREISSSTFLHLAVTSVSLVITICVGVFVCELYQSGLISAAGTFWIYSLCLPIVAAGCLGTVYRMVLVRHTLQQKLAVEAKVKNELIDLASGLLDLLPDDLTPVREAVIRKRLTRLDFSPPQDLAL